MRLRTSLMAAGLLGALVWAGAAQADGLSDLATFLKQTRQGRTTFTQVVESPRKSGEGTPRRKTSSGTFEFQRPDRFRFQYTRPFEQSLVADGQTLWWYDVDLNQVTARAQEGVLGQTPAALIATAPDVKALERAFVLANVAVPDAAPDLQWVQATPRQADGTLQHVRIGFRQGQLAALDILDSFGQSSRLQFGVLDTQPGFAAGHFAFKPPAGAEVLRP